MTSDGSQASGVRRRFRRYRTEAALTGPGTALILGGLMLAAVGAYVLERRGVLVPGAWVWGLLAGLPVLVLKVLGDLFDRDDDAAVWREVLAAEFGSDMRLDPEVSRQARQVIEFRARLAEATARARPEARRRIAPLVPQLDPWADGIVRLAREVSTQRSEAQFQSGLASKARSRQDQVQARAGTVPDAGLARQLSDTAAGLGAQIASAEGFSRHAEGGLLRLEQSVAAFGAACSQLSLMLAQAGDAGAVPALAASLAEGTRMVERDIARIGSQVPPPPPRA
jgi:hypothetical protein